MREESLLAPNFLFRFAVPARHATWAVSDKGVSPKLGDEYELPCLRTLEGRTPFARVRMAWSEAGVAFQVTLTGKKQSIWRRGDRLGDSDGVQIWLATRETQNVHRAGRFCHRFAFLPPGPEKKEQQAMASSLPIARATAIPNPPPEGSLRVAASPLKGGYEMHIAILADALTGYDPNQHAHLALNYAVIDRELGWQTMALGPEFPAAEDPSLWCVLDLVRGETQRQSKAK